MTTTQHTPGPWAIRANDLMQRIETRDGHTVAIPAMNDGVPALTCSANARLISAAPELLAALIAIQTTRPRDTHGRISYKAAYEAMLRQARAAIATATATGEA